MQHDNQRYGTFSSSSAWKLTKSGKANKMFGEKALTYIKQVNYELKLKRAIGKEHGAKPTSYGTFLERFVFDLLPLEYKLVSQERLFHPTIPYWSGAPDLIKNEDTVADVKAPYSLESFCDKIEALKDINVYKKEFEEDYWQHISNAILLNANGYKITHFEAVIFVPYLEQIEEIKDAASNYLGDQDKIAFINWARPEELPYLLKDGAYQNLNIVRYPINFDDCKTLETRIIEAGKLLINQ